MPAVRTIAAPTTATQPSVAGSSVDLALPGPDELASSFRHLRFISSRRGHREIDIDVLLLREREQLFQAFLPANARLLVATERHAEEMLADVVDPDETRFDIPGCTVRCTKIVGPDRGGQAIVNCVDLLQHRGFVAPSEYADNRPEDLLARDLHGGLHVGEHGRLDIEPFRQRRVAGRTAPGDQPRPLALGGGDVAHHAIELRLGDDRAHRGRRIGRDAGLPSLDANLYALDPGVMI